MVYLIFYSKIIADKYGHVVEYGVDDSGATTVTKWYTMGRQALEMAEILPDDKTVYISDDGTNTMMTAFVMDTPKDLSSGTLYIAKFNQTDDKYGGSFDVDWIELGSATQDELAAMVDNITFDDIFEYTEPTIEGQSCSCPDGFTGINAGHESGSPQCLKVKDGMETAAAFFETRRYGAMMGGTTELSKFEGYVRICSSISEWDFILFLTSFVEPLPLNSVAYVANSKNGKDEIYAAMSDVRYGKSFPGANSSSICALAHLLTRWASYMKSGMEDFMKKGDAADNYDVCGNNDIRLPYNPCGCVYQMDVEEIDGWMQITKARGYLCGDTNSGTNAYDVCDVNNM